MLIGVTDPSEQNISHHFSYHSGLSVPEELGIQPHSLARALWAKLIRFGQILLDLGEI